jgi:hypothetical protein
VLSVYVNTRPVGTAMTTYRPFLKKRLTEETKAIKPRSPELESLVVDAARVQHYLDYDLKEFTRATAVFACYGDNDLFDAVQIPVEFPESLVSVGPLAMLYPLLRVADCYRRAAVLVCDMQSARLFSIALGSIEVRREIRVAQPPNGAETPGHADDVTRRHVKTAAHALEELAEEVQASWLLIGADPVIGAEIEAALTPAAHELLLGRFPWEMRIAESELAPAVHEAVEERERVLRRERVEEIVRNAPHGGAIVGVPATIEALRAARVSLLVLSEAFPDQAAGWACPGCRTFGAGAPAKACPACGKGEPGGVDLREELGAQALAQGADVHFVEARAVPAFDDAGGVGALTRYP